MENLKDAEQALMADYERERQNATDALEELIYKAQREISRLSKNMWGTTDFIETPAARYAEALHKMSAYSNALAPIRFLQEKEANS